MILTGENWSIGRKTLYGMGGRWMNEYGAMLEWYWQGKTEVLGEKHYTALVVDEWMSMSNGGMILTGENWSTGRKTVYSVGGRWMNECGAVVEWYWQGKTEVLGEKTLYSVGGRWRNEYGAMVEWYWQGKTGVLGEKHYTAWVVWANGGMILTGENWSTVKKTLYSMGVVWVNEYGAIMEWYGQKKTEVLGEKPVSRPLFPP